MIVSCPAFCSVISISPVRTTTKAIDSAPASHRISPSRTSRKRPRDASRSICAAVSVGRACSHPLHLRPRQRRKGLLRARRRKGLHFSRGHGGRSYVADATPSCDPAALSSSKGGHHEQTERGPLLLK